MTDIISISLYLAINMFFVFFLFIPADFLQISHLKRHRSLITKQIFL